jgi:hypothetical protein
LCGENVRVLIEKERSRYEEKDIVGRMREEKREGSGRGGQGRVRKRRKWILRGG